MIDFICFRFSHLRTHGLQIKVCSSRAAHNSSHAGLTTCKLPDSQLTGWSWWVRLFVRNKMVDQRKELVRSYFQPGSVRDSHHRKSPTRREQDLSEILTIANLRHVGSRICRFVTQRLADLQFAGSHVRILFIIPAWS